MQNTIARFIALALITSAALAIGGHSETPVAFCDLVENPQLYNGKEVTVRTTYKYGFEWQFLYCLSCVDVGRVWLEFSDDLDGASEKVLKGAPKGAGTVNLTVRGVFERCGSCGHLNGYKYRFVAHKISNLVVLIEGMKSVAEEKKAEEQWACGGANPK